MRTAELKKEIPTRDAGKKVESTATSSANRYSPPRVISLPLKGVVMPGATSMIGNA